MKFKIVIILGVSSLGFSGPAYAYLDPGTGSMILQMLLGGVGGFLLVGKLYWAQIKEKFLRSSKKSGARAFTSPATC